jgi:WD40 repeat protein
MKQGNWNRKDIPIDTLITLHQAIYQARERNRLVSHGGRVSSVIFSPDGKILASGGNDGFEGTVKLWSLNGKLLKVISTGKTNVENIRFSPDGKIIAASLLGKK